VILRVLNFVVIGALVLAAAYVYRIKFDSAVQAERLAKLRGEVRHERDTIAALRAQWGQLDNPARIEALAKRFLTLKPIAPTQFDTLDQLPERPLDYSSPDSNDPIGGLIENLEAPAAVTGTVPAPAVPAAPVAPAAPPSESSSETPAQAPAANAVATGAPAGPPDKSGAPSR
jgi:cell division protein FtsL